MADSAMTQGILTRNFPYVFNPVFFSREDQTSTDTNIFEYSVLKYLTKRLDHINILPVPRMLIHGRFPHFNLLGSFSASDISNNGKYQ
jgi:hypothetical protein